MAEQNIHTSVAGLTICIHEFYDCFSIFNILVNLPSQYLIFFMHQCQLFSDFFFILYHLNTFYSTFRCYSSKNTEGTSIFFIEDLFLIIRYCFFEGSEN